MIMIKSIAPKELYLFFQLLYLLIECSSLTVTSFTAKFSSFAPQRNNMFEFSALRMYLWQYLSRINSGMHSIFPEVVLQDSLRLSENFLRIPGQYSQLQYIPFLLDQLETFKSRHFPERGIDCQGLKLYSLFKNKNIIISPFDFQPGRITAAAAFLMMHDNPITHLITDERLYLIGQIREKNFSGLRSVRHRTVFFVNCFYNDPFIIDMQMAVYALMTHCPAFRAGLICLYICAERISQLFSHLISQ